MKFKIWAIFFIVLSSNSWAGLFYDYWWSAWESKKLLDVYGSTWEIQERTQIVRYSPLHISRWFIWQNYSGHHGTEQHLVNQKLNFNENILDLVMFPQRDGSYKTLLRRPFLDKEGGIDYNGSYGVYEKNGSLWIWLTPNSETGTDSLFSPYTNCGFLTGKGMVAYASDRRHEPEIYRGQFDPKTRKFYIRYTSAPIKYVYWSEWEGLTSPFLESRDFYKTRVNDKEIKIIMPGNIVTKPRYAFLAMVENKISLPLICNKDDFIKAKDEFESYLKDIRQPVIDRELSRMSAHEKSTFRQEDCDGIGLNYAFGCKQIDNYERADGNKNIMPKKVKPPIVRDEPYT